MYYFINKKYKLSQACSREEGRESQLESMRSTFSPSPDKLARTQGNISHIIQQPSEWILLSLWQNVNCFSLTLLLTDLLIISAVYSAQALCYQFLHYSDSQQTRPIRAQHNSCPRQELCETTNRLGIKSRCIRTALSFSAKLLVWRHSLLYIVFPLYSTLIDFVLKCVRRVLKPEVASRPFFLFSFFNRFIYFSIFFVCHLILQGWLTYIKQHCSHAGISNS